MATAYLMVDEIIGIHQTALDWTIGGESVLLRRELLESALMRPQMAAHYESAGVPKQAALLAVALSQSQAFIDGNKRAGALASYVFLRLNGDEYPGDFMDFARRLVAVAEATDRDAATDDFAEWLRGNVTTREGG